MNSGCAAALDRLQDFCFMAIKAANREPCTPPRSTLILTPAFVVYTEWGIDPKLGVKYYAALEAGTESISLSRLIQFICLMQSSSDTLLAGCHPDYPPLHTCQENVCHERILLNKLLDQCSDELIRTLYVIAQGILNQSK